MNWISSDKHNQKRNSRFASETDNNLLTTTQQKLAAFLAHWQSLRCQLVQVILYCTLL